MDQFIGKAREFMESDAGKELENNIRQFVSIRIPSVVLTAIQTG